MFEMKEFIRSLTGAVKFPFLTCFVYLLLVFSYLVWNGYPAAPNTPTLVVLNILGTSVFAFVAAAIISSPFILVLLKFRRATYWPVTMVLTFFATVSWVVIGGLRA